MHRFTATLDVFPFHDIDAHPTANISLARYWIISPVLGLGRFNQNHGRVRLYMHILAQSWQRLSASLLRWVRIARLAHGGAARSWAAAER